MGIDPNGVNDTGRHRSWINRPVEQQPGLDYPVVFKDAPRVFQVFGFGFGSVSNSQRWTAWGIQRLTNVFDLAGGLLLDKLTGNMGGGFGRGGFGRGGLGLGGSIWGNGFGGGYGGYGGYSPFNIDMSDPGRYVYQAPTKDAAKDDDKSKVKGNDDDKSKVKGNDDDDDKNKVKGNDDDKNKDKKVDNNNNKDKKDKLIKGLIDAIDGNDAGIITGQNTLEVQNRENVDNVQAGKANKANAADAKDKSADGLYKFFTITDQSGNQYTLGNPEYNETTNTITYTIVRSDSDLSKDNNATTKDKGFEFNKNYNVGTKLTVEVKDGKIIVTNSSGQAIATKDTARHITS